MERLTKLNEHKTAYFYPKCFEKCGGIGSSCKCDSCDLTERVCEKLGKYEDTGYTPEMVMDIARFAKKSHKQAMEYAIQIDGMQHWIPVSERLPEKDTECLIRYYNSKEGKRLTDIAWLDEEGNWQLIREAAGYFPRNFKKEITHWMPMSELYEPVCENP